MATGSKFSRSKGPRTKSDRAKRPSDDRDRSAKDSCLFLTGFMASGKTTVGKILAERLSMKFVDLDEIVTHKAGMSVGEIFTRLGEPAFRQMERDALSELPEKAVVALGAGAITPPGATVVCLQASIDETVRRLAWDPLRPLLQGATDTRAEVERLLHERLGRYRDAALIVDTTSRSPEAVAKEVEAWFQSR